MRKLNTKKKQKREKDRNEESSDAVLGENEYQDSKNGGSDENSVETSRDRGKKSKKVSAERANSDNLNVSEIVEGEEEYEVEDIVDYKVEGGISYFLIKWKGYDSNSNTWEPEDTLSCPDLVAKFKKRSKRPRTKADSNSRKKVKQSTDKEETSTDPNQEWEVEKIVDVAYGKNGVRLFRIRWKGYRPASDTWEPEENLNCEDLIEKFLKKRDAESKVPQKELREAPRQTKRFVTDTFGRRASKRNSGRIRTVYYDAE